VRIVAKDGTPAPEGDAVRAGGPAYTMNGIRMVRWSTVPLVLVALLTAAACARTGTGRIVPTGTTEPDRFLYDRGMDALTHEKWLTAREFFKQLNETYVQSPLRPDAKLAIGDTYIGEGGADSLVLAVNEFREFLTFFPLNRRADYAQFRLAYAFYKQMRSAPRDQTETRNAITEFQTFVTRYPNSSYIDEGRRLLREAKDRLSYSEFRIGRFYYQQAKFYPAAIARFSAILKDDPEYTNRDAVYFFLGESLVKIRREAEARPYFEKLVKEFEKSEYLDDSLKRINTLKAQAEARSRS
jgi:outer membrane assembly lipoprotein YfiO